MREVIAEAEFGGVLNTAVRHQNDVQKGLGISP